MAQTSPATETDETPDIVVKAKPKRTMNVEFVDQLYRIKPPKMSVLLVVAGSFAGFSRKKGKKVDEEQMAKMTRVVSDLVKLIFKGDAEAVQKRLEDPEDEADLFDVIELMESLTEASTDTPTS